MLKTSLRRANLASDFRLLGVLVLAAALSPSSINAGAVVREPGAIYLEDFIDHPVKIQAIKDASIFFDAGLTRYLGWIRKGAPLELQAVGDNVCRVRGRAQQGQVAGWMQAGDLSELPKNFVASLRKNAERQKLIRELIEKNEVAIGMRPEEVIASVGKPPRKSSRLDKSGRKEVWDYVRFERVPQDVTGYDRFGNLVRSTIYVKVPAGRMAIEFENDVVSSIEATEGTLLRDGRVRIVPPPIDVY